MFKYQVKFAIERQIDGWTDPYNDLEYDVQKETITVRAKNKDSAKNVAIRESFGWMTARYPTQIRWNKDNIKSIKRLK